MAGILLETWSNRKLIAFLLLLLPIQVGFFLIGGLLSPSPNNVQQLLGNICINPSGDLDKWYARRENCEGPYSDIHSQMSDPAPHHWWDKYNKMNITSGNQIVFSWRFPLPREDMFLSMSPWHQSMMAMMKINVEYYAQDHTLNNISMNFPETLTSHVRLGYKDDERSDWSELHKSYNLTRPFRCSADSPSENGDPEEVRHYECDLIPMFELGSVHHRDYLINLRIPSDANPNLGMLYDAWIYIIHQNGGFTFVWFSLKTILFPILSTALVWFVWKVAHLDRLTNVLERTLLAVGAAITLMNFPVDWLTLWIDMPFMLLYSDIRQGLFYSVLFSFWLIFVGEHMMDNVKRNELRHYWKQLVAVACCSVCMFLFDFCERGIQLTNPFFSIWSTKTGSNIALFFLTLAGASVCIYFMYLLMSVALVLRNICNKRSILPAMSKPRQKYYKNLIYRFSFLMVLTLVCAFLSLFMFVSGQVEDTHHRRGAESIQYTSAMQTGVYGMWNLYVFCLLILYSPSSKDLPVNTMNTDELTEQSTIQSEVQTFSTLLQKAAVE